MLFSVIIPVYNRAEQVKPTLHSVLAQTHRPLQLVLVDNCSTDDTLKVLQEFATCHSAPDFEVEVVQEQRHTASAARNRGFRAAKGEWVLFFDSDDTMRPTLVEAYHQAVARHGGALDVVVAKACLHSRGGTSRTLPYFATDLFANHILHSVLATQRYAARRNFFAATGGWNEDIVQWDDWELGVRLMLMQPRVACVTRCLVDIYDSGEASITGTSFSNRVGRWEAALDAATRQVEQSDRPDKRRILRLIDFKRVVLAAHYAKEGNADAARSLYTQAQLRLSQAGVVYRALAPALYAYIARGGRGALRLVRVLTKI